MGDDGKRRQVYVHASLCAADLSGLTMPRISSSHCCWVVVIPLYEADAIWRNVKMSLKAGSASTEVSPERGGFYEVRIIEVRRREERNDICMD